MKKTIKFLMLFTVIATLSFNVTSCKDDDVVIPEGDKTALNALIAESEALLAEAVEGTSVGFYQVGSKAAFQTVVDAANSVSTLQQGAFQTVIDAAVANLTAAKSTFEGLQIQNVSTEGLVAQWLFTGDATDFTGNGNDGVVSVGHADFGAGTPVLATDRFGNANSAYSFNEGAFINVPYTLALNPSSISIALWVNAAEIRESNRFMGLQSWNGFKFQLQSVNKSFFTASTTDGIYDKDTDPPLDIETWYHLTVTYTSGEMTFYVDGVQTQQYTDATGDLVVVEGHDLAIGVGSSKYADNGDNYDNDQIIPAAWGGYFHGSLDDIRLYNRVLTSAEVSSIYALEKPQ
ncbi:MAG: LamG domain-containing protein [Bacteroidales bacterium]|jgi:hypothetical protein|nr:LamG domain-containing protein [Bacteroidales bacterium]